MFELYLENRFLHTDIRGKKTMSMVSVIMPIYQAADWLKKSIQSVVEQTWLDFELILIDDGSTDGSGKICDDFARSDRRVVAIHQQNSGVAAARNRGLQEAKGDYVFFLDCDDTIVLNALEGLEQVAQQQNVDIVFCNYQMKYDDGKVLNYSANLLEGKYEKTNIGMAFEKLMTSNIAYNIGTKLYRRSCLRDLRFDEQYAIYEDIKFCLEACARATSIYYLNESYYQYNIINGNSLSIGYKSRYFEAAISFYENLLEIIEKDNKMSRTWFYCQYMRMVKEALNNAFLKQETFREEFEKICDCGFTNNAEKYLSNKENYHCSFKENILYKIVWRRCFWLLKLLWFRKVK